MSQPQQRALELARSSQDAQTDRPTPALLSGPERSRQEQDTGDRDGRREHPPGSMAAVRPVQGRSPPPLRLSHRTFLLWSPC